MDKDKQEERLRLTEYALSRLSGRWREAYLSRSFIYRHSKKFLWRKGDESPGTHDDLERCLDELVGRGIAESVTACLGDSTNNLKLYRMKR